MSVVSMTGHGHARATSKGTRVDVDVASVNRKQLDVVVNLPRPLQPLEPEVVARVRRRVLRGRVLVTLRVTGDDGSPVVKLVFNQALAQTVLTQCRRSRKALGLDGEPTFGDLFRLPGIVTSEEAGSDVAGLKPLVGRTVDAALDNLVEARTREGANLDRDLRRRLGLLRKQVRVLTRRAPATVKAYRTALAKRVAALAPEVEADPERLEREVVLFADRCDVTEELTRLDSHLDQALVLLAGKDPAGKSLDFLAQELLREINTVGAKSADAGMTSSVVTFKAELERFREQVQNLE